MDIEHQVDEMLVQHAVVIVGIVAMTIITIIIIMYQIHLRHPSRPEVPVHEAELLSRVGREQVLPYITHLLKCKHLYQSAAHLRKDQYTLTFGTSFFATPGMIDRALLRNCTIC